MGRRLVALIAALLVCGGTLCVVGPRSREGVAAEADAAGVTLVATTDLPTKLRNLRDIGLLLDAAPLSPEDRTLVLIRWLAKERAEPVQHSTGYHGGVIDTSWVQAQIIMTMREAGDARTLTAMADPGVRDGIIVALGWMGDASRTSELLRILETQEEPDVRALAATALGLLGASEAQAGLRAALTDEFSWEGGGVRGDETVYPVRQAAEGALRMLSNEGAMQAAAERRRAFAEAMGGPGDGDAQEQP